MNEKQRTRVSKFLSRHLRHDPAGLGLTLESGGWVPVTALLDGCRRAGLPISREIVERHGGTLKARGVLGHGSCFTMSLPLAPAEVVGARS